MVPLPSIKGAAAREGPSSDKRDAAATAKEARAAKEQLILQKKREKDEELERRSRAAYDMQMRMQAKRSNVEAQNEKMRQQYAQDNRDARAQYAKVKQLRQERKAHMVAPLVRRRVGADKAKMTALARRSVSVGFLTSLLDEAMVRASSGDAWRRLGQLTTLQVVQMLVQPSTKEASCNFIDALRSHKLGASTCCKLPLNLEEQLADWTDPNVTLHFVSHAWSYPFPELVKMVQRHERASRIAGVIQPVYWVDIFAVTQHFKGDFKDHPDSDFPGVVNSSESVVLTMYPWRAPTSPTRVWCLFEILQAVLSGVRLEIVLEDDFHSQKLLDEVKLMDVVEGIDANAAQATVSSDREYIMSLIRKGVGLRKFNEMVQGALRSELLGALLLAAIRRKALPRVKELCSKGAVMSSRRLVLDSANDPESLLALEAVRDSGALEQAVELELGVGCLGTNSNTRAMAHKALARIASSYSLKKLVFSGSFQHDTAPLEAIAEAVAGWGRNLDLAIREHVGPQLQLIHKQETGGTYAVNKAVLPLLKAVLAGQGDRFCWIRSSGGSGERSFRVPALARKPPDNSDAVCRAVRALLASGQSEEGADSAALVKLVDGELVPSVKKTLAA